MRDERGGIISGFLMKLIIGFALFAVVAFEFGAIIVAKVQIDGIAINAAQEAATEYGHSMNLEAAKASAERICRESGAQLVRIEVSKDGSRITVTARKIAKTLIVQHIGSLKKWRNADSTQQAGVH